MTLDSFFSALLAFPTSLFFIPLGLFLFILVLDLVFNVVESFTADIDLDLDSLPGDGLLLPPVLTKVPLMVALTVTFFIATVISFYSQQLLINVMPNGFLSLLCDIILIPCTLYVSLFIASWLLAPLTPVFDKKNHYAEVDFIGLKATVHSNSVNSDWGEVKITHQGHEFLLDAISEQGTSVQYGDEVIIVAQDSTSKRYIVTKNNKQSEGNK